MNEAAKLGAHHELQNGAERAAQQLIASWIIYWPKVANEFPPEAFPTDTLQQVAGGVLQGMLADGARDLAGLLTGIFSEAPEPIRAALLECSQDYAPSPGDCGPLLERLRKYDFTKRRQMLAWQLATTMEAGGDPAALIKGLAELEANGTGSSLASRLASRAFDHGTIPPKPVPILTIAGKPLFTVGNIGNVHAPAKAGKSTVLESMIAAVLNGRRQGPDTLGFLGENPKGLAVIHLDTEQSRFDHDALVRRAMRRANVEAPPAWLISYSVADLDIRERRQGLRHIIRQASADHGGVFIILLDGVADLCADPNDSEEAFALVHELHALAITHDCAVVTVLHENPGSEQGKTRGHLGSQLERKAETNLRLAKDSSGVTTIWAEKARHLHLPKEQGPCFAWNDEASMHLSCGTAGEMKSAANRERLQADAKEAFGEVASYRHSDLLEAVCSAFDLKERAAKDRVRKWAIEGVILKDALGKYRLSDS